MTTTKPSNAIVIDKCTQRLQAMKAYVQPSAEIPIDGVPHTAADVTAIYQTCVDTRAALATARAEVKTDMAKRATAEAARRSADRALKPWVIAKFGVGSKQALDFGFPPPKKPVKSPAKKVKAVAQAKATRTARHTMGPKAKAQIKGTVPTTEPAVPATQPPPTPAPAVTNGAAATHNS